MPSKEYAKVIQLGEWLEKYLNPSIKTSEYRKLAQDAYQIYDIYIYGGGEVGSDYALSKMAQFIEGQPKKDQKFYKEGLDVDKYRMISTGEDPLKLKGRAVMPEINGILKKEDININRHLAKCAERCLEVYWFQAISKQLFKRVATLDRWEDAFLPDGTGTEYAYDEIREPYSKLFQEIGVDELTRDVRILNSIDPRSITTKRNDSMPLMSTLNFFPWNVLVSRIVIDFLVAGGQNYFLFCEQCGKFTTIKRQTRKKFCSNTCRTRHRRSQAT